uniref:Uncharacterized protein n=1 Tax=Cyprinus carpio carpio TaxID=630221 RepID=A0A8C1FUZ8_CYPCA
PRIHKCSGAQDERGEHHLRQHIQEDSRNCHLHFPLDASARRDIQAPCTCSSLHTHTTVCEPFELQVSEKSLRRETCTPKRCTLQTKQSMKTKKRMTCSPGAYLSKVVPVVKSGAVAGQLVGVFSMYASDTGHDEVFPIATPRGRSSKFP